jgi:hypothetical protein
MGIVRIFESDVLALLPFYINYILTYFEMSKKLRKYSRVHLHMLHAHKVVNLPFVMCKMAKFGISLTIWHGKIVLHIFILFA